MGGWRGEFGETKKEDFSYHPVNVIFSIPTSKFSTSVYESQNDFDKDWQNGNRRRLNFWWRACNRVYRYQIIMSYT